MTPVDSPSLVDTLSRLQVCSSLDDRAGRRRWLEVLGLKKSDYKAFLLGQKNLPDSALIGLSEYLGVSADDILAGTVDFRAVSVAKGNGERSLPEPYAVAAFGRRRTTITSFDYIEARLGWKVRADTLRRFRINEAVLSDYMAPINMQFMTDVARHLSQRQQLHEKDFFLMGAHSAVGNRGTLIGAVLSGAKTVVEAYEIMFDELIKFFEQNTKYTIVRMDDCSCSIEVISYRHVAEALGVRHLGNAEICALKGGFLASITLYIGLPLAQVTEPLCVHRGDAICRYELQFPEGAKAPQATFRSKGFANA